MPGLIRASFGLDKTMDEIDEFVGALEEIIRGNYEGEYIQNIITGEFNPKGWMPAYEEYFSFD